MQCTDRRRFVGGFFAQKAGEITTVFKKVGQCLEKRLDRQRPTLYLKNMATTTNNKGHNMSANLGTVIAEAVMVAAVEIARAQGVVIDDSNMDRLIVAMRREAKVAVNSMLDQGKGLIDGGMSGWLNELLKVECASAARRAVDDIA